MLETKIADVIKKYNLIEKNDKVIIGVSGGPDSICLANILYNLQGKIGFSIVIAHVNKGIRQEAKADQEYVKKYCETREIPFEAKKVDIQAIAKIRKNGTEEAGREERYKFFNEVLEKYHGTKVATAHTKNDNCETVLMNMIRGTGISRIKRNSGKKR